MSTHVCPDCGRRFKCDQPTRTFAAESPVTASSGKWPTIDYEVYWGINKLTDALTKALAVWIPANAILLAVSMRFDWSPAIPQVFSVVSMAGLLRTFGKVPSWHNVIETELPAQPGPTDPEPKDTRRFVGWETESHTRSTQHMEWYTPPCPIPQARSFALALVNNGYSWVDERDLRGHKANISHSNYRLLRRDWLDRDWCVELGGNRTAVVNKSLIRRIALDDPE